MVTFYIDGPEDGGEGHYVLIAETGEFLAGHYCSNSSFARHDLHDRRTTLQAEWRQQFGEYQVRYLGEDDMVSAELLRRNQEWAASVEQPASTVAEG